MVFYLLIGIIVLIGLALLARHFVNTNPAQLAQGVRAFAAAFSALASTGLLFAGRFGLDPALASSILLTMITDAVGFGGFLLVASALL